MSDNKNKRPHGYLKGVVTDEVSFCGQGANQNAHISIVKINKKPQEKTTMAVEMEKKELDMLKMMAYMSDGEKAFWKSLDEPAQVAMMKVDEKPRFLQIKELMDAKAKKEKEEGEKKKPMKKDDGESIEVGGKSFSKADIGEGAFAVIKAQNELIEKAEKRAVIAEKATADETAKRVQKELEDEVAKLLPNLPGTVAEKAVMLKSVYAMPADQQKVQLAMLKAGDNAISKALGTRGVEGDGTFAKAEDQLDNLAKAHQKANPGMTFEKAYTVVLDTAEGEAIYNGMEK